MPDGLPRPDPARLAHLARDWEARAAQLERGEIPIQYAKESRILRQCAGQLLALLGIPPEP